MQTGDDPLSSGSERRGATVHAERRAAPRTKRIFYVQVHGRHGTYRGMVDNVGRTGALLTITDHAFDVHAVGDDEEMIALRVAFHFGEGMHIRFLAAPVNVEAEVAHVTEEEHGEGVIVRIGCRFHRDLTQAECNSLGIRSGREAVAPASGEKRRLASAVEPEEPERQLTVHDLLKLAVNRNATDIHVKAGSPPRLRIDGDLVGLSRKRLNPEEALGMVRGILTEEQFEAFDATGDLDVACTVSGYGRFRVNVMRARDVTAMAIRLIPEEIPTIHSLGLAPACRELSERPRGLVLVTGPTGSGKSTTLAAMVDHVNRKRPCHILTMEDPVEYIHREIRAHITQREVGRDTDDFALALRRALRQDPDVIMVGEMRDLETIALAVTAAETGHLVFATLHTPSAPLTIDRIVDVFPPVQQRQIRMQLADSLQGVISQMLAPRVGGGVAVAQEVLVASDAVRALIREGKTPQLFNVMQTGAKDGMQTLEDSLNDLVARGVISYETAVTGANVPKRIQHPGNRV